MMKTPFVTKEQLDAIAAQYPTPFHIYDEAGIRENARRLREAFSWNPGYREYFAVKATPTPAILKILKEEDCGCDCSSLTELLMSEKCGITGENIMFSSNDTPAEEFQLADKLGAIINLDDITHVDFVEKNAGLPDLISARYNPGPLREGGNTIIGNPITTADGTTVIPVSKVSFGFGTGGTDFASKHAQPGAPLAFGGGGGAGVTVSPVCFLIITKDGGASILGINAQASNTVDRLVEMIPGAINKVSSFVEGFSGKKNDRPAETAEAPKTAEE